MKADLSFGSAKPHANCRETERGLYQKLLGK